VIHTPGHTAEGICVYNPLTKTLFSGDTIINDKGTVKLSQLLIQDTGALNNSLNKLKRYEVDHLYPGWGMPVCGHNLLSTLNA
jgi:glyoxylase-like metal-dependent hydrolase (beta-lactamase superfamily II)